MQTDLELASQILNLEGKWLQPFALPDPFNGGQEVEGYLSLLPDHRYGAMAILRVAGRDAPQLICATPKLHYPFDRAGTFRFPAVRRIHFYEKLDGTNVLAYRYRDAQGQAFYSFKLRLSPFLRNGRFGNFLDLWRELVERYPGLLQLAAQNDCSVSLEMYGNRNAHLIEYSVPLEPAVLFGIGSDWQVVPPMRLDCLGVPPATCLGEISAHDDPTQRYQALRAEMEQENRPAEDDRIAGTEGSVWYAETPDDRVLLWKCKPESVEAIHWAVGINKAAVLATCRNALESLDALNLESLRSLLLEEYSADEIDSFTEIIEACIAQVLAEMAFKDMVMSAYGEVGLSILTHKAEVMRALSTRFERSLMKKVYSVIARSRP